MTKQLVIAAVGEDRPVRRADRDLAVAIPSDPTQPARSGGYFGDLMGLIGDILATA